MTEINCLSDSSTRAGCFLTHSCASLPSVCKILISYPDPTGGLEMTVGDLGTRLARYVTAQIIRLSFVRNIDCYVLALMANFIGILSQAVEFHLHLDKKVLKRNLTSDIFILQLV